MKIETREVNVIDCFIQGCEGKIDHFDSFTKYTLFLSNHYNQIDLPVSKVFFDKVIAENVKKIRLEVSIVN